METNFALMIYSIIQAQPVSYVLLGTSNYKMIKVVVEHHMEQKPC